MVTAPPKGSVLQPFRVRRSHSSDGVQAGAVPLQPGARRPGRTCCRRSWPSQRRQAETGGWGVAQASPAEPAENEARMREWILNRGSDMPPQPAAAPQGERRGFFRRLFGG